MKESKKSKESIPEDYWERDWEETRYWEDKERQFWTCVTGITLQVLLWIIIYLYYRR